MRYIYSQTEIRRNLKMRVSVSDRRAGQILQQRIKKMWISWFTGPLSLNYSLKNASKTAASGGHAKCWQTYNVLNSGSLTWAGETQIALLVKDVHANLDATLLTWASPPTLCLVIKRDQKKPSMFAICYVMDKSDLEGLSNSGKKKRKMTFWILPEKAQPLTGKSITTRLTYPPSPNLRAESY